MATAVAYCLEGRLDGDLIRSDDVASLEGNRNRGGILDGGTKFVPSGAVGHQARCQR